MSPALALERIDFSGALTVDLTRLARATPVWMGGVVKVVARYATPFWRAAGLAGAAFSRTGPFQEIHGRSGPDGHPAALFGFAHGPASGPDFATAVTAQLHQLFGPAPAAPEALHLQDWSSEPWTATASVRRLTDHGLFGHALYQRPALDGRLHRASTETALDHAGHGEGALAAADRAAQAAPAVLDSGAARRHCPCPAARGISCGTR
ncbi:FAD-dependent oxidoreductase [Streptomyces sp. NPDC101150]|uniref:FAD-dependent oxidoreductase n=1 Tax=Streptomyces sp. NPDC101150 TaxID=3366114 RepID=UPI0038040730